MKRYPALRIGAALMAIAGVCCTGSREESMTTDSDLHDAAVIDAVFSGGTHGRRIA